MKICVIGTGYVGLVTGVCLADKGNEVICVDNVSEKVTLINSGKSPIYEPGLEELLRKNMDAQRFRATTDVQEAVLNSEIIFLCLPTPEGQDGSANLQILYSVVREIAPILPTEVILINKSTVPAGTTDYMQGMIKDLCGKQIRVASNPEFLRQGSSVQDTLNPSRIVIGTRDQTAMARLFELYSSFVDNPNDKILFVDPVSAEMIKNAANSFLAIKISYANQIANICEKVGADVEQVMKGVGMDPRIGTQFLKAGIGWGGSCFPKDVQSLMHTARQVGVDPILIQAADEVNNLQASRFVQKIKHRFANAQDVHLGVWGLTFKPDTDDLRCAPSLRILPELIEAGFQIQAHDPQGMSVMQRLHPEIQIEYCQTPEQVLDNIEALLILTEWSVYRQFSLDLLAKKIGGKVIFDGRNIFDPALMQDFEYYSIGR